MALVLALVVFAAVLAGSGGSGDTGAAWEAAFLILATTLPALAAVVVLATGLLVELGMWWRCGRPSGCGIGWLLAGTGYATVAWGFAAVAQAIAGAPTSATTGACWTAQVLGLGAWLPGLAAGPLLAAGFTMELVPLARRRARC